MLVTIVVCVVVAILSKEKYGSVSKKPSWIPLILTFVFATRNSLIWFFLGISFDKQIVIHKFFSYISVIFGWVHGIDKFISAKDYYGSTLKGL
jgi:predicted ferric reductase